MTLDAQPGIGNALAIGGINTMDRSKTNMRSTQEKISHLLRTNGFNKSTVISGFQSSVNSKHPIKGKMLKAEAKQTLLKNASKASFGQRKNTCT